MIRAPAATREVRRWLWRGLFAALAGVAVWIATDAGELGPHPLALVALIALAVAVGGLVVDSLSLSGVAAWVPHPPVDPRTRARDPRTGSHLHLLEAHLAARTPDDHLASRLIGLAEERLRARHGLAATSEEGRRLLGEPVDRLRAQPDRRLTPDDVDRVLRSIERL